MKMPVAPLLTTEIPELATELKHRIHAFSKVCGHSGAIHAQPLITEILSENPGVSFQFQADATENDALYRPVFTRHLSKEEYAEKLKEFEADCKNHRSYLNTFISSTKSKLSNNQTWQSEIFDEEIGEYRTITYSYKTILEHYQAELARFEEYLLSLKD